MEIPLEFKRSIRDAIQEINSDFICRRNNRFYRTDEGIFEKDIWANMENPNGYKCPCERTLQTITDDNSHKGARFDTLNILSSVLLGQSYEEWRNQNLSQNSQQPRLNIITEMQGEVPPSMPGHWLSYFTYTKTNGVSYIQLNIGELAVRDGRLCSENILACLAPLNPLPDNESDNAFGPTHHKLEGVYWEKCFLGIWKNHGANYFGSFQFYVLPSRCVMKGKHLFNQHNGDIEADVFMWVKIEGYPETDDIDLRQLKGVKALKALIEQCINNDRPVRWSNLLNSDASSPTTTTMWVRFK